MSLERCHRGETSVRPRERPVAPTAEEPAEPRAAPRRSPSMLVVSLALLGALGGAPPTALALAAPVDDPGDS